MTHRLTRNAEAGYDSIQRATKRDSGNPRLSGVPCRNQINSREIFQPLLNWLVSIAGGIF
jgi:hypothetical protein